MPDAKDIMKLREVTGAGIVDCRNALEEAGGSFDAALDLLRKRGQKVAAAKQERVTNEGVVQSYIHGNGKVGVLVEVLCETDFVARNEGFREFAHDVALQIAATNPLYLRPEDIATEIVEKEIEIYKEQMAGDNKPEEIKTKIIQGKLAKYYEEVCLLKQKFIKDDSLTMEDLLNQQIGKIGENIQIRRFCRFAL